MATLTDRLTHSSPDSNSPGSLIKNWYHREPTLARSTLVVVALIPVLMIIAWIDNRTLNDVNIWRKPLKFNVSIAIYFGTLVWFSGWTDHAVKQKNWYRWYVFVLVGTLFLMLPWLYTAAWLGEPAHFNRTHPVLAPIYGLMGIVSVVFTTGTIFYAALIATNKQSRLSVYFRHAVVWSLISSFLFTVVLAGELASMDSHWIGGTHSDAGGLWPFGWSRDGGDLRVAHFFSLHAMHFIPAIALVGLPGLLKVFPRITAVLLSFAYSGFILYVYFEAKMGQPFLPWLG